MRVVQGVGGAMVMANSTAIITDAFPPDRRGFALGVNQVSALAGSFLGLIIGGVLSEWHWRAVFWVSVPVGVWGTWMGYRTLHDKPRDRSRKVVIDWWGNLTFGVGLIALLVGDHLRPAALRRAHHGLDVADACSTGVIGGVVAARRVRLHREPGGRPDDQHAAVQGARVRGRPDGQPARGDVARRPAVHADHLAAGHLAAAARLQLRRHPAVGRHLHAAAHARAS